MTVFDNGGSRAGQARIRRWSRALGRYRRWVAALLAGVGALLLAATLRPPAPATVTVLTAARELAGGVVLATGDIRELALPAAAVPASALRPDRPVVGSVTALPIRTGEILTDVRLTSATLLTGSPGQLAVPLRLTDGATASLLSPGDRVDVYAATPRLGVEDATGGTRPARLVAEAVRVLTVRRTATDAPLTGATNSAMLVVAADPTTARELAGAVGEALSVAVRGRQG